MNQFKAQKFASFEQTNTSDVNPNKNINTVRVFADDKMLAQLTTLTNNTTGYDYEAVKSQLNTDILVDNGTKFDARIDAVQKDLFIVNHEDINEFFPTANKAPIKEYLTNSLNGTVGSIPKEFLTDNEKVIKAGNVDKLMRACTDGSEKYSAALANL